MRLASRWLLAGRSIVAASVVITVIGFLLAWLGSLYDPSAVVQVRQFWVVGGVGLAALFVVFGMAYPELTRRSAAEAITSAPSRLPEAIYSLTAAWVGDGPNSERERIILVLTPTDLLSVDGVVSIFHREAMEIGANYERFVGLGVVETVNQGGRPQVVVFHEARGGEAVWLKVRERDAAARKSLVIRPGADYQRIIVWRAVDE